MSIFREIPIGPEADELWRAGVLYVSYAPPNKTYWVLDNKDGKDDDDRLPTVWTQTDCIYAVCVDE